MKKDIFDFINSEETQSGIKNITATAFHEAMKHGFPMFETASSILERIELEKRHCIDLFLRDEEKLGPRIEKGRCVLSTPCLLLGNNLSHFLHDEYAKFIKRDNNTPSLGTEEKKHKKKLTKEKKHHKKHQQKKYDSPIDCEDRSDFPLNPTPSFKDPDADDVLKMIKPKFQEVPANDTDRFPLDSAGDTKFAVAVLGDVLAYVGDTGFVFDGVRWRNDANVIKRLIERCVIARRNAFPTSEPKDPDTGVNRPLYPADSSRVNGILSLLPGRLAKGIEWLDALDADPYLLNCANGVVDLRTGELLEHSPELLVSKLVPYEYDETADCPRFRRFIREIFADDEELITFWQTFCGYCLSGSTAEQSLTILYGSGGNGKSVLLDTMRAVLKDYSFVLPASSFVKAPPTPSAPNSDIASLRGTRMVVCSEWADGTPLDEGKMKNLTGSNTISARHLYQNQFEFVPHFKVLLDTNYLPRVDGLDDGIWRRMKIVPFRQQFTKKKRDLHLLDKLKAEAPGILNWMIIGTILYFAEGKLNWPSSVKESTKAFRHEIDSVGSFFQECIDCSNGSEIKASKLFSAYSKYCRTFDLQAVNLTQFGRILILKKIEKRKKRDGNFYINIKLKEE